ncbi:signal protein [Actinocorallia libanotica]|uniref:Lipoprotein n=1 Tax=Actinocorallia libanotica TaxID=46162 RepID=A0ABN1RGK4_9ACTN
MIRHCSAAFLLLAGLLGGCAHTGQVTPSSTAAALDPAVVQGAWWSWAAAAPAGRNPVEDETGEHCAVNQPSGMWFLAGTFGGRAVRKCTVPSARNLVAPLVNRIASEQECADLLDSATGQLKVDGVARPVLRWKGSRITVNGVADNPVTRRAGVFETYGCGLWAETGALEPGRHKVTIRGTDGDFRIAVDYHLLVTDQAGEAPRASREETLVEGS